MSDEKSVSFYDGNVKFKIKDGRLLISIALEDLEGRKLSRAGNFVSLFSTGLLNLGFPHPIGDLHASVYLGARNQAHKSKTRRFGKVSRVIKRKSK